MPARRLFSIDLRLTYRPKVEWKALALPGLHQCDKYVQAIALGRIPPGPHQSLDFLEDATVIPLGLDGLDFHVPVLISSVHRSCHIDGAYRQNGYKPPGTDS